jgi:hypothetical protein
MEIGFGLGVLTEFSVQANDYDGDSGDSNHELIYCATGL